MKKISFAFLLLFNALITIGSQAQSSTSSETKEKNHREHHGSGKEHGDRKGLKMFHHHHHGHGGGHSRSHEHGHHGGKNHSGTRSNTK